MPFCVDSTDAIYSLASPRLAPLVPLLAASEAASFFVKWTLHEGVLKAVDTVNTVEQEPALYSFVTEAVDRVAALPEDQDPPQTIVEALFDAMSIFRALLYLLKPEIDDPSEVQETVDDMRKIAGNKQKRANVLVDFELKMTSHPHFKGRWGEATGKLAGWGEHGPKVQTHLARLAATAASADDFKSAGQAIVEGVEMYEKYSVVCPEATFNIMNKAMFDKVVCWRPP